MSFFFFKQKTAYEMRISDWSSDVCSSDLQRSLLPHVDEAEQQHARKDAHLDQTDDPEITEYGRPGHDEDDFQVENDELDGDEVVAHVELHARVLERREPAFVRRQLLRSGALGAEQEIGRAQV